MFAAPVAVRSYELPKLSLRFGGMPRGEDLRIDPWPLVVAALATEEAAAREGLGDLRPDTPPPLREPAIERAVLGACAAAAVLLGAYLAFVYFGLPWWGRQHRPFTRAYRAVLARHRVSNSDGHSREACQALHAAFNQTAGRTVFAESLGEFVAQAPRFASLRGDMDTFFTLSQTTFFGGGSPAHTLQHEWLLAFAKACRDTERGSA